MINLSALTISKTQKLLQSGDFSAAELVDAYFSRIEKKNPELNAYLEVYDDAKTQAEGADKMISKNKENAQALAGIPIALKDNIVLSGRPASCASKILENYTGTYDATVVQKLREAGAVFLGRTNMDEFAMGSSTEHSAFGSAQNPFDSSRSPGGSSGGSAAAVSADIALCALGSDTGGSIRQPASFCGVVGLKPTYGAVSRSGLVAMASSFDQIGPLAKTIEDTRIIFEVISGHDEKDSTSQARSAANSKTEVKEPYTIGVPTFLEGMDGVDKDVMENFWKAMNIFENAGHNVRLIDLDYIKHSLAVYYVVVSAELSSNLARFDGVRYGLYRAGGAREDLLSDYMETRGAGFGKEVRRRILLGTYVLSSGYYDAYYGKAVAVRARIAAEFEKAFRSLDCIALPTTPTPAFKLGEKTRDPLAMYFSDVFTVPANVSGIPALSVPSGKVSRDGVKLPVGLQLLGGYFNEQTLFQIGEIFERAVS